MGATYTLFSTLSAKEMFELDRELQRAMDDYFEEHPDADFDAGEAGPGGLIPSRAEVEAAYANYRLPLPEEVLTRLAQCRSTLSIDRPGDIEVDGGLQVTVLRFILERAGPGLLMLNDYPLITTEALLAQLKTKRGVSGFGPPPPAEMVQPLARREEKLGELRAVRILAVLEAAEDNVELAVDLRATLSTLDDLSHRYLTLLVDEGALSDTEAAKRLGADPAALAVAADRLSKALIALR